MQSKKLMTAISTKAILSGRENDSKHHDKRDLIITSIILHTQGVKVIDR